jgi:diaminopropionate ammonia-lyase
VTEYFANPRVDPAAQVGGPPARRALAFHAGLPGYRPTPLVDAPALAGQLGIAQLLIKDETSRLGLPAFKALGASWAIFNELQARFGGTQDRPLSNEELRAALERAPRVDLVAATDGNHGRAVAHFGAVFGLVAHIFIPKGAAPSRVEALEREGATVTVVDGTYDDAVAASAELEGPDCLLVSDTVWDVNHRIPAWVVDGYSTLLWEVQDELERRGQEFPEIMVVQIGVGSLATAVVRHVRCLPDGGRRFILGVEPTTASCAMAAVRAGHIDPVSGPHNSIMAGLNCGEPADVALDALMNGVDAFVSVDDDDAIAAMRSLAAAGVLAGESGAAGLAGLTRALASPDSGLRELGFQSALVICTEGVTAPEAYAQLMGLE